MKKFFWISLLFIFLTPLAEAGKATPFQGWYEILSIQDRAEKKEYFLLVADTLGNIWARFGEGPLPPDLEKYRHEPSILTGFTNRGFTLLNLERSALITENFLIVSGEGEDRLELARRPDGKFDMGTRQGKRISLYLLAPPKQIPDYN